MKNRFTTAVLLLLALCLLLAPLCAQAETVTVTITDTCMPETDLPEADELFAAYAERVLYAPVYGDAAPFGTLAYSRLSAGQKKLYDYLKPGIQQIAAGQRNSSAFVLENPSEDLGLDLSYTAEELGVSSIVSGGSIANDALDAFQAALKRDLDYFGVQDALLSDCPYDLYWYQKTNSSAFSFSMSISATSKEITLAGATISFQAASPYGTGTTLDTSVTGAASAAAENAEAIVAKHAGKSDLAMLTAYRDEICALVTYDDAAAGSGVVNEVIDPWQVIHVFDGDTSTNVVCEGYSKAFQYLCDLSAFQGDVYCYSVTGVMGGGTGSGPHMWNIVDMNGIRYLVDVTNSDSGTVGQDGELFMKDAAYSGTWNTQYNFDLGNVIVCYAYDADQLSFWGEDVLKLGHDCIAGDAVQENVTPATCTAPGSCDSVVYCTVCEEEMSREAVTLPAAGHTPGEAVVENEIAATCTAPGSYDSVVYCTVCEEEVSRTPQTTEKLPHTEGEAVVENEVAATCTAPGSYDSVVYCTICEAELSRTPQTTERLPHTEGEAAVENEVAATCTAPGSYDSVVYCTVCEEELSRQTVTVPVAEHTPGRQENRVTSPGSCTEDKWIELVTYCELCDAEMFAEPGFTPAPGHTPGEAVTENETATTCTEDGSHDSVVYCTVCEEELSRETATTPAPGHTPGRQENRVTSPGSCTEDKWIELVTYCELCDAEMFAEPGCTPAPGHTPGEAVTENETAATCTVPGGHDTVIYCTVCEEEMSRETATTPAPGHTPGRQENRVTSPGSCTEDKWIELVTYCELCDAEMFAEPGCTPAPGHTPGEAVTENETAATCTVPGGHDTVIYCTVCEEELSRETTIAAAPGHTEVETEGSAPTCTEPGQSAGICCTVCGESLSGQETLPPTGHTAEPYITIPATHITTGMTGGSYCIVCGEMLEAPQQLPVVEVPMLVLPASLKAVGEQAFSGSSAVCVIIPDGCASVGAKAFADCASLRFVEFPDSVTAIDATAFDGHSDSFVFVAAEGSYALEYATEHEIPCVIK